ncbi:MAG: serine/threonine-protein kinase, partial [Leptolyngbyaceae bacterium]|nr:serine/threonine-protein kinase [Leptolyngbyaceae bacterium]
MDQKTPNPSTAKFCSNCGAKLLLGDRYRAIKSLGEGFYSRTLLAVDEHKPSKTRCIIKQTPMEGDRGKDSEEAIDLFHQEAMRLEELGHHPQIPSLLAHFIDHKHYYLIQSHIEGISLGGLLKTHGAFSEDQIRQVLNDCLPILQFIHAQQIIHRNITPENLVYAQPSREMTHGNNPNPPSDPVQARLCLVDFESAKFTRLSNLFMAGTQIGSRDYAPPEQLRGRATFSSDLYSLGVTCLHLLTQKHPTHLYDMDEDRWQWRTHQKHPVSQELGQVLDTLVMRLVRDRYSSANEALEALNGGLSQLSDRPTFIPFMSSPTVSSLGLPDTDASEGLPEVADPTPSSAWSCRQTLTQHDAWVRAVALSQDGQLLASGSGDKTVRLWSTRTGELLHTLTGHSTWVRAIAISPDTQTVASGSNDKSIRLWEAYSGSPLKELQGHSDWVRTVVFMADGQTLLSAGQDKTIRFWDTQSGTEVQRLTGHQHWVVSLALDPLGRYVASGSRDRTIRLWNLATGQCFHCLKGHTGEVLSVAISPNGQRVISSSADHTIRIWEAKTGQLIHTIQGQQQAINAIAISPDGTILVAGSNDKTVCLWDLSTYTLMDTLTGHNGWVWTVAIAQLAPHTPIIASG